MIQGRISAVRASVLCTEHPPPHLLRPWKGAGVGRGRRPPKFCPLLTSYSSDKIERLGPQLYANEAETTKMRVTPIGKEIHKGSQALKQPAFHSPSQGFGCADG